MNRPLREPLDRTSLHWRPAGTRFLTLRETAVFLNVHPNTVRSQVRRGELPGAKIGGGWRFLEADLLAWVRLRYPARAQAGHGADEGNRQWPPGGPQDFMLTGSRGMTERALDALLEPPARPGRRTVPRA